MEFLDILTSLLKSHNMTRSDLARAIDVPPSTINSWYARGAEKVSIKILQKIANYFHVSMEYLINGRDVDTITFDSADYTTQELEMIKNFAKMLKESRC